MARTRLRKYYYGLIQYLTRDLFRIFFESSAGLEKQKYCWSHSMVQLQYLCRRSLYQMQSLGELRIRVTQVNTVSSETRLV